MTHTVVQSSNGNSIRINSEAIGRVGDALSFANPKAVRPLEDVLVGESTFVPILDPGLPCKGAGLIYFTDLPDAQDPQSTCCAGYYAAMKLAKVGYTKVPFNFRDRTIPKIVCYEGEKPHLEDEKIHGAIPRPTVIKCPQGWSPAIRFDDENALLLFKPTNVVGDPVLSLTPIALQFIDREGKVVSTKELP